MLERMCACTHSCPQRLAIASTRGLSADEGGEASDSEMQAHFRHAPEGLMQGLVWHLALLARAQPNASASTNELSRAVVSPRLTADETRWDLASLFGGWGGPLSVSRVTKYPIHPINPIYLCGIGITGNR